MDTVLMTSRPDRPMACSIVRVVTEPYLSSTTDEGFQDIPQPITQPTVIIWWSPHCAACRHNEQRFRTIEGHPNGFRVVRVKATREVLQRYPHVTSLPSFDLVWPETTPGATSVFGPATRLQTVRNFEAQDVLSQYFPKAFPSQRAQDGIQSLSPS